MIGHWQRDITLKIDQFENTQNAFGTANVRSFWDLKHLEIQNNSVLLVFRLYFTRNYYELIAK